MNCDEMQEKIFAAARPFPLNEAVPYAFEHRIMNALREQPQPDVWALWSRLLWRAAAPCVGIMLVLSCWTALGGGTKTNASASLASDLEWTVWGPLTSLNESW